MNLELLANYGDIIAIPFFLVAFFYFYKIKNKTPTEYILMLFTLIGFMLDSLFTYIFLNDGNI